MAAPGFYTSLLRGYGDTLPEDWDLEAPETEGILKRIGKGALGLLGTAGRAIDYPARVLRRAITGLDEPTGRDVLKSLGVDIGPGKEGFDVGDIASFSTEVLLDPTTYIGGIGGLTKLGRAAKAAGPARELAESAKFGLSAAEKAGDLARAATEKSALARYLAGAEKYAGVPALEKGWRAQARAGQRQLLDIGLPFTRYRTPIMGGERALGAMGELGEGIARTAPYKKFRELFGAPKGLPETAGQRAYTEELLRQAAIKATEGLKTGEARVAEIAAQTGKGPEEVLSLLGQAIEKPSLALTPPTAPTSLGGKLGEPAPSAWLQEEPIRGLARDIKEGGEQQFKYEELVGNKISRLQDDELDYLKRIAGPEGRQYIEELKAGRATNPFFSAREHPTAYGSQIQRNPKYSGMMVPEANKFIHEHGGPEKFFLENPIAASVQRAYEGDVAAAHTILGKNLIRSFAKETVDGPAIRVGDFAERGGFRLTGENPNLLLRQDVADEFLKMRDVVTNPEKVNALVRFGEGVRKYMSQAILPLAPAYHGRNAQTNAANTMIAGLFDPVQYFKDWAYAAKQIWKGTPEAAEWGRLGVLHGGQTLEFSPDAFRTKMREITTAGKPGLLERLKRPSTTPGIGGAFRFGQKVGEIVEGAGRVAHYRAALRSGMDPLSALESVKKYLFNFDELSSFEKKALRPLFFFFAWQRRQLGMLFGAMAEKTGEMATMFRATTQPSAQRGTMPPWLRSTTAIPAGRDIEGNRQYFSGLGSPLEPIQNIDFLNYPITERIGSQLTPALRVPIEALTGKDLRFQADISQLNKSYRGFPFSLIPGYRESVTPRGKQITTADPTALWLLRSSPLSRAASTMGQLTDPRKELLNRIMSVTTGARVVSVDESAERKRQALEAIKAQLKAKAAEGKAQLFSEYFATGAEGEKDPETQLLIKLAAKIRKT